MGRDHPREYGENTKSAVDATLAAGSSPRIRGKSYDVADEPDQPGIIPANTGKMCVGGHQPPGPWDHPREYGENSVVDLSRSHLLGSSPRIRGKSPATWFSHGHCGIIPANTGKIYVYVNKGGTTRDHPREYGENLRIREQGWDYPGSSPRIRGKSTYT